mmetsp:Transcript_24149/g.48007  ORF Transcript_24149/g.48007 Transcript_24149/m.48007 type:complete len:88 (-) Transcript_24149:54-317(-)
MTQSHHLEVRHKLQLKIKFPLAAKVPKLLLTKKYLLTSSVSNVMREIGGTKVILTNKHSRDFNELLSKQLKSSRDRNIHNANTLELW